MNKDLFIDTFIGIVVAVITRHLDLEMFLISSIINQSTVIYISPHYIIINVSCLIYNQGVETANINMLKLEPVLLDLCGYLFLYLTR